MGFLWMKNRNDFRGTVVRAGQLPRGRPVVCCLGIWSATDTQRVSASAGPEMLLLILFDVLKAVAHALGM